MMGHFMRPIFKNILHTVPRSLVIAALMLTLPLSTAAQSLNYIDEAGNIHFVDNLNDVPMQYRNQFIAPQPTLQPGSRAAREYEKTLKQRERELEREKKMKEKEEAKKKKLEEKKKREKEKEKAREKKKKKSTKDK